MRIDYNARRFVRGARKGAVMSDRFDDTENNGLIGDDEHDVVEFSDDEGNKLLLEVMDYFFYNGEEYAVLMDADEAHEHVHGPDCVHDDEDEEDAENMYIMRVLNSVNDDGEEMEEFVPVEDGLLDQLVEVVQARFADEEIIMDDEDDDYGEEEDYDGDENLEDENDA
jgi:hypothetical protein